MIMIAGGTGSLGGRITRALRARGEAVRALVRPSSDAAGLEAAGVEIVRGDLKDPASLARACAGARTVITTASMSRRGDDSVVNVDLQGNQDLIEAAETAGVEHFIFVSTGGASPDSPVELFRAKGLAEERLRASGRMAHTVLQANIFMDVWFGMLVERPIHAHQPVTLVGESRRRHSFVAEADVASFAAAATRHPGARNATIPVGGPEALTWRDVVRAYEAALGRPVEVRSVAPGEPIPGLPPIVWGLAAGLESHDSIIPMVETAAQYGVRLTSVVEFARGRMPLPAA